MTAKLYWVLKPDKTDCVLAEEQSFDTEREADNWISLSLREMREKNKINKNRGYFCPSYILIEKDDGRNIKERFVTL